MFPRRDDPAHRGTQSATRCSTRSPPLAPHGALTAYDTFLESRPPVFETCAVEEILSLGTAGAASCTCTSCTSRPPSASPILKQARADGINITAETCFSLPGASRRTTSPDGDTRHKCCPPIRKQRQPGRASGASCSSPAASSGPSCPTTPPAPPELKLLLAATSSRPRRRTGPGRDASLGFGHRHDGSECRRRAQSCCCCYRDGRDRLSLRATSSPPGAAYPR